MFMLTAKHFFYKKRADYCTSFKCECGVDAYGKAVVINEQMLGDYGYRQELYEENAHL
jgi:hypothetical protein